MVTNAYVVPRKNWICTTCYLRLLAIFVLWRFGTRRSVWIILWKTLNALIHKISHRVQLIFTFFVLGIVGLGTWYRGWYKGTSRWYCCWSICCLNDTSIQWSELRLKLIRSFHCWAIYHLRCEGHEICDVPPRYVASIRSVHEYPKDYSCINLSGCAFYTPYVNMYICRGHTSSVP